MMRMASADAAARSPSGRDGDAEWMDESMDDNFERAQQQALELLFQQCVDELHTGGEMSTLATTSDLANGGTGGLVVSDSDAASFMDFLAQACEDASDALQEISPEDVAKKLAEAVAATQKSLREVKSSVNEILDDPEKMQTICQHYDEAGAQMKLLQLEHAEEDDAVLSVMAASAESPEVQEQLAVVSNEESLRSMMQFTDNVCGVLDNALSTITKDEYEMAAQLSLSIAQKLLEAGQAMFMSIGDEISDESRTNVAARGDQSDRITIEELSEEDQRDEIRESVDTEKPVKRESLATKRLRQKREQRKQATVVRTYLLGMANKAQERAADHPVAAAAIGVAAVPFIGLAIPIASMVGLALVMEKHFPEHTALTLELVGNFVQMAKLWLLLVKISARQLGSIAKQCLMSWHDHATQHGYAATGLELVSTGFSLSWLCASYLYNSVVKFAQPTP